MSSRLDLGRYKSRDGKLYDLIRLGYTTRNVIIGNEVGQAKPICWRSDGRYRWDDGKPTHDHPMDLLEVVK